MARARGSYPRCRWFKSSSRYLRRSPCVRASFFASPSTTDREHLDAAGHAALANAIYEKVIDMQKELEKAV